MRALLFKFSVPSLEKLGISSKTPAALRASVLFLKKKEEIINVENFVHSFQYWFPKISFFGLTLQKQHPQS